ncbi:hypothetical protein R6G99_08320, partial [Actinotignum timonense]|nr:hypothetical protein [Actinotignum timonense]
AFTSATVGLLVGVVGGIILAKFGARRGQAKAFRGMDSLPDELLTGVLDANKRRPALGYHTFSGGSIETLSFEVGIVSLVAVAGYGIGQLLKHLFPGISFPLFAIAFLVGIVVRIVMNGVGASHLLDAGTLRSVSGLCTDILIVCGIASIQPEFVSDHLLALGLLFLFGLILCTVLGLVVAPRLMGEGWFERQLFTWGWATGSVSTGLALLRIVDPKLESGTIEQFGYAYLPVVPVEISAVSFVPVMALAGMGWAAVGEDIPGRHVGQLGFFPGSHHSGHPAGHHIGGEQPDNRGAIHHRKLGVAVRVENSGDGSESIHGRDGRDVVNHEVLDLRFVAHLEK